MLLRQVQGCLPDRMSPAREAKGLSSPMWLCSGPFSPGLPFSPLLPLEQEGGVKGVIGSFPWGDVSKMTIVLELNGVVCTIPEFVFTMSPSFPLRHSSVNRFVWRYFGHWEPPGPQETCYWALIWKNLCIKLKLIRYITFSPEYLCKCLEIIVDVWVITPVSHLTKFTRVH